ncbi:MAG: complex I subunit 5 family protein [Thermoprotei archaeon]|nr:proton-conducting transporter membrane subunit [TACK group archaeon]
MADALGLYVLLLPFAVALVEGGLGRYLHPKFMAGLSALAAAVPGIFAALEMISGGYQYVFLSAGGLGQFSVLIDGLNWPVVAAISIVSSAVSMYSVPYMRTRFEDLGTDGWGTYFALYVLFFSAMFGMVESNNFILFYVFLELALVPSFLLILFYGYGNRGRISMMYFIWTHVGALTFLLGALIYGSVLGTFNFYPVPSVAPLAALAPLVAALLLVGLLIKMAAFGVHVWLPYAHAEAPTPISALLSPNLIGIAGYALVRMPLALFRPLLLSAQWILLAVALLTVFYGGLLVFRQTDLKRLLAYSSIAQMGYILLGIASFSPLGIAGAMLQYFAHAIGKSVLFSSAGVMITENEGLRDVRKMGGVAKSMPYTASLSLWGFMNISGLPPSVGFFSKLFILLGIASLAAQGPAGLFVFVLVLISLGLTPAYSFFAMKKVFFGPSQSRFTEGGLWMLLPSAAIGAFGLLAFLFPGFMVGPLLSFLR